MLLNKSLIALSRRGVAYRGMNMIIETVKKCLFLCVVETRPMFASKLSTMCTYFLK